MPARRALAVQLIKRTTKLRRETYSITMDQRTTAVGAKRPFGLDRRVKFGREMGVSPLFAGCPTEAKKTLQYRTFCMMRLTCSVRMRDQSELFRHELIAERRT
jgi:hypothetical protein